MQLKDTEKVSYSLSALDAKGNATALDAGDTVAITSADPNSVAVVADATPAAGSVASGFLVAGTKLTAPGAPVQISAAVTKADGTAGPTGSTTIDVVASATATIGFTLGAPVAQ